MPHSDMLKPLSPQGSDPVSNGPTPPSTSTEPNWPEIEVWWLAMAHRLGVRERGELFFRKAGGQGGVLARASAANGDPHYILFVLLRYWIPAVLPPPGRERLAKGDQDYWLECEQILKAAASRLRELKPLIELLTAPNPIPSELPPENETAPAVVEVELARMLDGIAEVAGSYGGPDYTSVIKTFDPIPFRQTQPFKHNKKNSAELWVIFLLREHFRMSGLGKDRYWPLIAELVASAGIHAPHGSPYTAEELKSWWQKNWPRTYTQLEQKHNAIEPSSAASRHDFEWFRAWFTWQLSRPSATPPDDTANGRDLP